MARLKNKLGSVELRIRSTPLVIDYLEDLVNAGLYGKTRSEVAEEIIRQGIKNYISDGVVKSRTSRISRK